MAGREQGTGPVFDDILADNREIFFDRFHHDDAFALGCRLREETAGLPVAIAVRFGVHTVFQCAAAGTSASNANWLTRKLNVVTHFEIPSLLLHRQFGGDAEIFGRITGLDTTAYAPAGGGFPLRVAGSMIGAVAVSGLTDEEDHEVCVRALRSLMQEESP